MKTGQYALAVAIGVVFVLTPAMRPGQAQTIPAELGQDGCPSSR